MNDEVMRPVGIGIQYFDNHMARQLIFFWPDPPACARN